MLIKKKNTWGSDGSVNKYSLTEKNSTAVHSLLVFPQGFSHRSMGGHGYGWQSKQLLGVGKLM